MSINQPQPDNRPAEPAAAHKKSSSIAVLPLLYDLILWFKSGYNN